MPRRNPMAKLFLTGESKAAFSEAVRAVEEASSAELVVAVRQRSGSYVHVNLTVGILVGLAALAFLLYSPWSHELIWFLVDPVVAVAVVCPVRSTATRATAAVVVRPASAMRLTRMPSALRTANIAQ